MYRIREIFSKEGKPSSDVFVVQELNVIKDEIACFIAFFQETDHMADLNISWFITLHNMLEERDKHTIQTGREGFGMIVLGSTLHVCMAELMGGEELAYCCRFTVSMWCVDEGGPVT